MIAYGLDEIYIDEVYTVDIRKICATSYHKAVDCLIYFVLLGH